MLTPHYSGDKSLNSTWGGWLFLFRRFHNSQRCSRHVKYKWGKNDGGSWSTVWRFVGWACGAVWTAHRARTAQVTGATISGTVTDPSSAAVPNATVATKNIGTGVTTNATTNADGFYTIPNLQPGTYDVTTTAPGFSVRVDHNITLDVGAKQSLPIALQVGQTTQTVEVTGAAPTVELSTATISSVVDSTTVRELPLNGRDWTQLATLEPGISTVRTQASTNSATTNRANRGFGNQLTVSGHSPYENNYRVNGISINDYTNGSPGSVTGVNLGTDAIQEFRF